MTPRPAPSSSTGEGAYEGLYAVMGTDWDAIVGFIFTAPPPEAPTAP